MSQADESARCDALLVKFDWPEDGAASPSRMLKALATLIGARLTLHQSMPPPGADTRASFCIEGYAYFAVPDTKLGFPSEGIAARDTLRQAMRRAALLSSIVRLQSRLNLAGAPSGRPALFHYTIETDVTPVEMEPGLNAWYDTEHLLGLATLPGIKRAARFTNLDSPNTGTGAASHACYDLFSAATIGSPAWSALLNTAWSQRVHPHLCNTKYTLFKRIDG